MLTSSPWNPRIYKKTYRKMMKKFNKSMNYTCPNGFRVNKRSLKCSYRTAVNPLSIVAARTRVQSHLTPSKRHCLPQPFYLNLRNLNLQAVPKRSKGHQTKNLNLLEATGWASLSSQATTLTSSASHSMRTLALLMARLIAASIAR